MRLNSIELLVASGRAAAEAIECKISTITKELETSSATSLLNSLDICNTQVASSLVGIFSLYEARLQKELDWTEPRREIKNFLIKNGAKKLADEFHLFELTVNALKHGNGQSFSRLKSVKSKHSLDLQCIFDITYTEGDCSLQTDLVYVSTTTLYRCCDVIEESWSLIEELRCPQIS